MANSVTRPSFCRPGPGSLGVRFDPFRLCTAIQLPSGDSATPSGTEDGQVLHGAEGPLRHIHEGDEIDVAGREPANQAGQPGIADYGPFAVAGHVNAVGSDAGRYPFLAQGDLRPVNIENGEAALVALRHQR
jgi:hypothetical protein